MAIVVFWLAFLPVAMTSNLDEVLYQISQLQKSIVLNTTEQAESQQSQIDSLVSSVQHAVQRISELEEGMSGANAKISNITAKLDVTQRAAEETATEIKKADVRIEQLGDEIVMALNQMGELTKMVENVTENVDLMGTRLSNTEVKLVAADHGIDDTNNKVASLSVKVTNFSDTMTSLDSEVQKTGTQLKRVSEGLDKAIDNITSLQQGISKTVSVDSEGKIASSLLPGSYSNYTLEDVQWQSLHMAAAAACTATESKEKTSNVVVPARVGEWCFVTCFETTQSSCRGTIKVGGYSKHVTDNNVAGYFNSYSCQEKVPLENTESHWKDEDILKPRGKTELESISYCCCNK